MDIFQEFPFDTPTPPAALQNFEQIDRMKIYQQRHELNNAIKATQEKCENHDCAEFQPTPFWPEMLARMVKSP